MGNCGHNFKCGCSDAALTTPISCPTDEGCENPEICSQIWDAHCVVYNGDEIVDLDINPGDRMDVILQKQVLNSLNPGCINPLNTCRSVLNLRSTSITTSTISIAWDTVATAVSYQLEYKVSGAASRTLNPAVVIGSDVIGGLLSATDYNIRINAICASGGCYSLTINVKTK